MDNRKSTRIVKSQVRLDGLVKNEEGKWVYPATQRSDGTWRKPVRIRDDFSPDGEQEKYVIKPRRNSLLTSTLEESTTTSKQGGVEQVQESFEVDSLQMESLSINGLSNEKRNRPDHRQAEGNDAVDGCQRKRNEAIPSALPSLDTFLSHWVPAASSSEVKLKHDDKNKPLEKDQTKKQGNYWNKAAGSTPAETVTNQVLTIPQSTIMMGEQFQNLKKEKENSVCSGVPKEDTIEGDLEDFNSRVIAGILDSDEAAHYWNFLVNKWRMRRCEQMLMRNDCTG